MRTGLMCILIGSFWLKGCRIPDPVLISHGDIQVLDIRDSLIDLSSKARMFNPWGITYTLDHIQYSFEHNGLPMGYGELKDPVRMVRKDTAELEFLSSLSLPMLSNRPVLALRGDSIGIRVIADARASHPLKSSLRRVEFTHLFSLKQLLFEDSPIMGVTVVPGNSSAWHPLKYLLQDRTPIGIEVELRNRHSMPYRLKELSLLMTTVENGNPLVRAELDSTISVSDMPSVRIPLDADVKNSSALRSLFMEWISGQPNRYRLTGQLQIEIMGYPIDLAFDQEVPIRISPI